MIKKINITLKEIAEAIKELIEENSQLIQQLAEKEKENTALAHIIAGWNENNQDKISFCIEKLEKVKEMVNPFLRFDWNLYLQICENIDDQIKQLKEGK